MSKKLTVKAIKIQQPIGEFFIAKIPAKDLVDLAWVDVRRMSGEEGEIDKYIGIQRRISIPRVRKLREYVSTSDATFPTSVIVAAPAECVQYDSTSCELTFAEFDGGDDPSKKIDYSNIAKVLDGQHRLRAFASSEDGQLQFDFDEDISFELSVTIFIGADISTQATIFSIVNLAQTKVNKSLVYDLYSLAKTRSPQKSAHFISVALDENRNSPLFQSIKRLGTATPGRSPGTETLTQAAFVEALVPYISDDPVQDRDFYLRKPNGNPPDRWKKTSKIPLFRQLFIDQKEGEIAKAVWSYFKAVSNRWPKSWAEPIKGNILKRTNGFRALMSVFGKYHVYCTGEAESISFVSSRKYLEIFKNVDIEDGSFTAEEFPPGSSGEARLRNELLKVFSNE